MEAPVVLVVWQWSWWPVHAHVLLCMAARVRMRPACDDGPGDAERPIVSPSDRPYASRTLRPPRESGAEVLYEGVGTREAECVAHMCMCNVLIAETGSVGVRG